MKTRWNDASVGCLLWIFGGDGVELFGKPHSPFVLVLVSVVQLDSGGGAVALNGSDCFNVNVKFAANCTVCFPRAVQRIFA